jgi:hypothetical protein
MRALSESLVMSHFAGPAMGKSLDLVESLLFVVDLFSEQFSVDDLGGHSCVVWHLKASNEHVLGISVKGHHVDSLLAEHSEQKFPVLCGAVRQRKAHKSAAVLCESQVLVKISSAAFRLCVDISQHLVQESALLLASGWESEEVL